MYHALARFDFSLIHAAVDLRSHHILLTYVVYVASKVLIFLYPLVLWYLWRSPEKPGRHHGAQKAVIIALMAVVIAFAVKEMVSLVYFRPRPIITYPSLTTLDFPVDQQSFPSGHTMLAFTVATSLLLSGYRRWGSFLLVCAFFVGLGRVFAGVHYPSDVIAGAVVGVLAAWYLHRESSSLKRYLPNS